MCGRDRRAPEKNRRLKIMRTDNNSLMEMTDKHCGWFGSISEFLNTSRDQWLSDLKVQHEKTMREPAGESQIKAWKDCFGIISAQLETIVRYNSKIKDWTIIFEYELPRERGRRPDIIILGNEQIFVLEFKAYSTPLQAHIDQVAAYGRDIAHYHYASHGHKICNLLVLTKYRGVPDVIENVTICPSGQLADVLIKDLIVNPKSTIDAKNWLESEYRPLPSLISAARTIFKDEALPRIKRAHSAGIPETVQELLEIAATAKKNHERHLIIVTGVPGSGKTLVGIQFVYESKTNNADKTGVFLSGNGPLVEVMQHALKSKVFVQDVHGFLLQYGKNKPQAPSEHILIYDEAQRAWDEERSKEKRGTEFSEAVDFLSVGEKVPDWSVIVALVGEGQEIHIGEEGGIVQWNDALAKTSGTWIVHCPHKISSLFSAAKQVRVSEKLNLTASLRSHVAEDVHGWVASLLQGDLNSAHQLQKKMYAQGFDVYVSRSLEDCKRYVRERYSNDEEKRYGIIASSKAKILPNYGVLNDFDSTQKVGKGPWYNNPLTSEKSCCQLKEVVTEFGCQGLELDFPIVCWGDDLFWNVNKWQSKTRRSKAQDPHNLRINSYRVLLTRGRDGMVIFVPNEKNLDGTYQALVQAGAKKLQAYAGPILVVAAIIKSGDRLLITKKKDTEELKGAWEFPGGTVEYGEDPKETLVREINEELGCTINVDSIFDTEIAISKDGKHFVIIFYLCSITAGTVINKEHERFEWINKEKLKDYDFVEADKQIAKKLS